MDAELRGSDREGLEKAPASARRAFRHAVAALTLLLAAGPLRAGWLGSLGTGIAKTDGIEATPVVELFFATPDAAGFRLYSTLSWSVSEEIEAKPDVLILAASKGLLFDPNVGWIEADAGVTGFAFEDYEDPVPFLGFTAGAFLGDRTNGVLILSADDTGSMTVVAKIALALFRK